MQTTSSDPLLQSFTLKGVTLRNRIVSTSHEPGYAEGGLPKDRYRLYHVEKAKGGCALTMIGSASVAPDSPPAFGNLLLYQDEIVEWLRRLSDAVHEHGAAIMCQVTHLGRRTNSSGDWLPLLSASPLAERAHRAMPKEAEDWDLHRIKQAYADAAVRCKEGGFDGIELQAFGHLLDSFWSPATNHRDDEWGGSLDNRMRFPLEVIRAVRLAVGDDYIVGIRMAVDEARTGGVASAEGMTIARQVIQAGIDFVSVIRGHIDSDAALSDVIPPMGTPSAPHLRFAGDVRQSLSVPVMHAGRINDVSTARLALTDGLIDLVGMTRSQMADPYLVAKIESGDVERIRPCVGANYCLGAAAQGGYAKCIHNASTGREDRMPHLVARTDEAAKRCVVVGAGPAGLEAARVLAERGHRVLILEALATAGGQVRLAAAVPRRRELMGIIDWRISECERLGVEIRYEMPAVASDVIAEEPNLVIVATGGVAAEWPSTGSHDLVATAWDVLSGGARPAGEVLVFDDTGNHAALDAVELLCGRQASVEFITPDRTFAANLGSVEYPPYLRMFGENHVGVSVGYELASVDAVGGRLRATLSSSFGGPSIERVVDQVVVDRGTLPQDDLYFALKPRSSNRGAVDYEALVKLEPQPGGDTDSFQMFRVGDAVSGRDIHAAIYDAFRLCVAV
jgi:2,4-dienoyl-CoA reductase-like NADH-dependent reductase (Old Yellow Enzyme family)